MPTAAALLEKKQEGWILIDIFQPKKLNEQQETQR